LDQGDGRFLRKNLKVPYLQMQLPPWNPAAFLAEARAVADQFVDHRSNDSEGWRSLCLHGIDQHKTLSFDRYGYSSETAAPYRWTQASESCPLTSAWLKGLIDHGFYEEIYRARFMWLKPKGFIRFHRDRPEDQSWLGPLNIALNMPEGCRWLFKKWGPLPIRAGSAFSIDVSQEHGVWNESPEDRIHIIVHGLYGPAYHAEIANSAARVLRDMNVQY